MKTLYDLDVATQWEQILELHVLALAKEHHPDWYRWRLTNNYERAVFLKGDSILPRETQRYEWAAKNLLGNRILEVGCSTGYGTQFLPKNIIEYTGLDYDPIIISVAKEQKWNKNCFFEQADINNYKFDFYGYDTIIAFEVIEHLDNGLEIVNKLKNNCKRLLITVPHNEPKGFWGEHHKLHGLTEKDFPNFEFEYINEHGQITKELQPITPQNRCNLMLCKYSAQ
jgi:2-polyprenyl-3-methyl-5-hydroxy-6-metoxy-1,4-benzoquinol methylase